MIFFGAMAGYLVFLLLVFPKSVGRDLGDLIHACEKRLTVLRLKDEAELNKRED